MNSFIPPATLRQDDPSFAPGGQDPPTVSLLRVLHRRRLWPHCCVCRGPWEEGRKYKAPLSTRGKGKGMGRLPKLPSEILRGGRRALPPGEGGRAAGYLLPSPLGASHRLWRLPTSTGGGDLPGLPSFPLGTRWQWSEASPGGVGGPQTPEPPTLPRPRLHLASRPTPGGTFSIDFLFWGERVERRGKERETSM